MLTMHTRGMGVTSGLVGRAFARGVSRRRRRGDTHESDRVAFARLADRGVPRALGREKRARGVGYVPSRNLLLEKRRAAALPLLVLLGAS